MRFDSLPEDHVYFVDQIVYAHLFAESDVEGLIRALRSDDRHTREVAAETLGDIGDVSAVEPLISVLNSEENNYVRADIAVALGKIGDPRAVEPLIAGNTSTDP